MVTVLLLKRVCNDDGFAEWRDDEKHSVGTCNDLHGDVLGRPRVATGSRVSYVASRSWSSLKGEARLPFANDSNHTVIAVEIHTYISMFICSHYARIRVNEYQVS